MRAAKKRMAPVPPFWDICQWQNFPGNLNTWPNTYSKRFFLLPFLQPKKNVQKSKLLHWCCPLRAYETVWSARKIALVALSAEQERHTDYVVHMLLNLVYFQLYLHLFDLIVTLYNNKCINPSLSLSQESIKTKSKQSKKAAWQKTGQRSQTFSS